MICWALQCPCVLAWRPCMAAGVCTRLRASQRAPMSPASTPAPLGLRKPARSRMHANTSNSSIAPLSPLRLVQGQVVGINVAIVDASGRSRGWWTTGSCTRLHASQVW